MNLQKAFSAVILLDASTSLSTCHRFGSNLLAFGVGPKTPSSDVRDGPNAPRRPPPFTLKRRNPYDVHVYYDGPSQRREALELRAKMRERFPWMRFFPLRDGPIGPHPVPMWEADFGGYENRHRWDDVRAFVERERGGLSVLIHPHSEDGDYADHTTHAFWAGEVLDLRLKILK